MNKAGQMYKKVNVEGTKNVVTEALKSKIKHISHISSSAIFGSIEEKDCPITDNTIPHPLDIYGKSKYEAEKVLLNLLKDNKQMTYSIIRPRTIIGKERLGIFQILFEWISEGVNIYTIGDGLNLFQFAHIDDLVNVSVESALQRKSGIFNVGTDKYRTLKKDLTELCEYAGTGSRVKSLPVKPSIYLLKFLDKIRLSPLAPWHYLTYHKPFYFDISKPMKELGWKPKASNIQMMKESYDWYLKHKHQIKNKSYNPNLSTHKSLVKQGIISLLKKIS